MNNIIKKLNNKTIIIIAHRIETIKDVDFIYVLKDGKIIEQGKYQDLLNQLGYFNNLHKYNK